MFLHPLKYGRATNADICQVFTVHTAADGHAQNLIKQTKNFLNGPDVKPKWLMSWQ